MIYEGISGRIENIIENLIRKIGEWIAQITHIILKLFKIVKNMPQNNRKILQSNLK